MKRLFSLLLAFGLPYAVAAQNGGSVLVDFSELLYFTIPLYILTAISLGLFLLKLIRPYSSWHRWIYLTISLSILGGLLLTWKMDDIRDEQMIGQKDKTEVVTETAKQEQEERSKERADLSNSAFWTISIPNIALLALSLIVDATRRKRFTEKPAGRPKRYKD